MRTLKNFSPILGLLFCLALTGCGKANPSNNHAETGSLSPSHQNAEGGALYQQYQRQFPANLESITAEELMAKWPNAGFIVQSADGTKETVFATVEVYTEVVNRVEEAYPSFNEDEFVEQEANKIVMSQRLANNMSIASEDVRTTADLGISEEELATQIQEKLEKKYQRIEAEKRFMTFGELTKPEVQNQIAAGIAGIQQSMVDQVGQFVDIGSDEKMLLSSEQVKLLLIYPFFAVHTLWTCAEAPIIARLLYGKDHDKDGPPNSFQHSYWAALVACAGVGIPFIHPSVGQSWGEKFTNAREKDRSSASLMDIHNDKVGAKVFRDCADYKWKYKKVRIGWFKVKIPVYITTFVSREEIILKLREKVGDGAYVWRDELRNRWVDGQAAADVGHREGDVVKLLPVSPDKRALVYISK